MKKIISALLLFGCYAITKGQSSPKDKGPWKDKKCAVVLTYDDGLNIHLTNALPALDSLGLKATFYISDYYGRLEAQIPTWKKAAAHGHELGNHTMFHPCTGRVPGREWVSPDYDLSTYSLRRIREEIKAMNNLLSAIDGRSNRTFAYPCNDKKIGDSSYLSGMEMDFTGARSVSDNFPIIEKINLFDLPSFMVNGESGEQLIALVDKAMSNGTLLVFLFHGVGGDHALNVSLPAHRALLRYLKSIEDKVWIAPMNEVSEFLKDKIVTPKNKSASSRK